MTARRRRARRYRRPACISPSALSSVADFIQAGSSSPPGFRASRFSCFLPGSAPAGWAARQGEGRMKQLDGKIAWVTGAGSGIGEAAAIALAAEGATVVLTGRRREPLDQVAATIGQAAHVAPGDMTESSAVQAIADGIDRQFGRLDIPAA